jgi:hypothetical protein
MISSTFAYERLNTQKTRISPEMYPTDDKPTNEMVRRLILLCEQEDRRSSF